MADVAWNPDVYLAFADHRGRPFFDLTGRIHAEAPRRVVDLGCGPGNLTATLAQRWPDATLEAVDNSPEMVAAARERGIDAVVGGIDDWTPRPDTDVVVSNAALQWLPEHAALIVRWARQLGSGAWMAFQVPNNTELPSHQAMREVAGHPEFAEPLADMPWRVGNAVESPERYADLLSDAGCVVDAWETRYVHNLTGPDPVLGWMTGTALTQVKSRLNDEQWAAYRQAMRPLLDAAYPMRPDGTTFYPFRRVFVVARVN
jgi:trans-aconitate 2-methyltransferase